MREGLNTWCVLGLLSAMAVALAAGLLAWGPVLLTAQTHGYADSRSWLGVPNAMNVLASVPVLACAVWGWRATAASTWPRELQLPWRGFHACAIVSSLVAMAYHAWPLDASFLLSRMAQSGAFLLLGLGLMAEGVDLRFGGALACASATGVAAAAGSAVAMSNYFGLGFDMRPLLLLEILPVLLIPAGAISLAGRYTRRSDWSFVLLVYATSRTFESADAGILAATEWVSGHSLMHLSLGLVVGWAAYSATVPVWPSGSGTPGSDAEAANQRQTSLNTTS